MMDTKEFIALIGPAAQASEAQTGIPASFTVAQAALESSWGKSRLANEGKNLFGVKADAAWTGDVLELPTREFLRGRWVSVGARWRKYADWQDCLDDHAKFFRANRRYRPCFDFHTGEGWAKAVAKAGYATDPKYAEKLISVITKYSLHELDRCSS